jgi:thiamine-monophosphate kinase
VGSPKLGRTQGLVEDEIVERIRGTLGGGIEAFGLRDDAALVEMTGEGPLVVSVDSVVAGVHFDLSWCSPADVGWKALMGALSDLAAMGARPLGALVALCVPDGELAVGVTGGVAEASALSGCPVLGGDVSAASELMVAVTVMGTVDGGEPVTRQGAEGGDALWLTGPCGGSAAGLRNRGGAAYQRPLARLAEGTQARLGGARAMIDVSDGLALDLHRLADRSGVGFRLEAAAVPVSEGATLEEALGGGEDYELLMAVAEGDAGDLVRRFEGAGLRRPWRIGTCTADAGVRVLDGEPLGRLGWQHPVG